MLLSTLESDQVVTETCNYFISISISFSRPQQVEDEIEESCSYLTPPAKENFKGES